MLGGGDVIGYANSSQGSMVSKTPNQGRPVLSLEDIASLNSSQRGGKAVEPWTATAANASTI